MTLATLKPTDTTDQELILPVLECDPEEQERPFLKFLKPETEEEQEPLASPLTLPFTAALPPTFPSPAPTLPAIAHLTPLFETMASAMMILDLTAETHTIVTLNHPAFADSPLFGTQIIIKEFSTSPKTFNVEILTSPEALVTLQQAQEQLLAHFEHGNFNFHIHRFETHLHTEPPSLCVDPDQEKEHDQDQHSQEDHTP